MKHFIIVLFISGVLCGDHCQEDDEDYYARLDKLTPEDPCSQVGGTCTFAEDCPQLTGTRGQCPRQQSQGVECCYGISVRDYRCSSQGGICVPADQTCGSLYKGVTDCKNEKCCILV